MPWQSFFYTYITLPLNTDLSEVDRRLDILSKKLEKAAPETKGAKIVLQPIADIHLHSHLNDELEAGGNKNLNYILVFIGLIILVIAWINYINIETARFITRAREVGVRRIIGSGKGELAMQFLVEYSMITVTSALSSWLLLQLLFPYYSYFTGIPISRFEFSTPHIWLLAFGFFMVGSFLAGIYPALFLLRLDPVSTLKGKISGIKRGTRLRKALLIVQLHLLPSLHFYW